MSRDAVIALLEALLNQAEAARTPPAEGPYNALAAEFHHLRGALSALRAAGALPDDELSTWQKRADALAQRMSQEFREALHDAARKEKDARLQSRMGVDVQRYLQGELWSIAQARESWIEHRNDPAWRPRRHYQAEGAAMAFFRMHLLSFEDYCVWGEMFAGAAELAQPPAGAPETVVAAETAQMAGSTLTLGLAADPWRLTSLELLTDGVRVNLLHHGLGPRRYLMPRVALSDNLNTHYERPKWGCSSSPDVQEWQFTFAPDIPVTAESILVAIDKHRFRIRFAADRTADSSG